MDKLFEKLKESSIDDFYVIEAEFFEHLYQLEPTQKTSEIIVFLNISNWLGFSLRDGVWTYYEVANPLELQTTLDYLKQLDVQMETFFQLGIHDYQNPQYSENYNYPDEWIIESEKIDDWIFQHEKYIWKFEKNLLLKHEKEITKAFGG